jgi:hypothetical protein
MIFHAVTGANIIVNVAVLANPNVIVTINRTIPIKTTTSSGGMLEP